MRLFRALAVGAATALLVTACAGGNGGTGGNGGDDGAVDESDLPAGVSLREDGAWMLKRNEPVYGGSLSVALEAPAEAIDPARNDGGGPAALFKAVFDTLVDFDENGEVTPHLAESFKTLDDGTNWELKLRPGVKFTDGTDFNAEAVMAHWNRIGAEGSLSRNAADVRSIETMVASDPLTVSIKLKVPSLVFSKSLVTSPYHLNHVPSPASVEQWGDQVGFHPIGAGPFIVTSFTSGGDSVMERNPNYWQEGLPYLDEIRFVLATDTQTRLAGAVAGDLDLGMSQMAVDLHSAEAQGLLALYQPTTTYFNLIFNLAKPPFDDVRFREAVIRGIDLDGLNSAVFDGEHKPMRGLLTEDNPFFVDTDWPAYDPEKSKELIAEWSADTGLEPEFDMVTTSPPEFQKQAAIMQQMLADVGITMNLAVGDQPTMISEARTGNYISQHRFIGVTAEVDQVLFSNLHSQSAGNNSHGGDPRFDQLLIDARTAKNTDERRAIYTEMQEVLREWLPMMPQIQHRNGWYVGSKVGGFPGVIYALSRPDPALLYIAE